MALGIVNDSTGSYAMGFVFLVAFAWFCAGLAVTLHGREQDVEPESGDVVAPVRTELIRS